ncbi:MAG: hypothetical protein ACFE96_00385 [Candidatus Hermodarchaeota archaeon]
MDLLEEEILLFELDEESEDFKEIEEEGITIGELLDSSSIVVIVDSLTKVIWIWEGKKAGVRKKFIATQNIPSIRDRYGIDFKITTVDEGDEPLEFMEILGFIL